ISDLSVRSIQGCFRGLVIRVLLCHIDSMAPLGRHDSPDAAAAYYAEQPERTFGGATPKEMKHQNWIRTVQPLGFGHGCGLLTPVIVLSAFSHPPQNQEELPQPGIGGICSLLIWYQ